MQKGDTMSFIETTDPAAATGDIAALYQRLQGRQEYLPNYARIFCHRPAVMAPLATLQDMLKEHMDARLWALIALAVAREIHSSYCSLAFARRLLRHHFSQAELLAIVTGDARAPLTAGERAAMDVAVKLASNSSAVSQQDIDRLRSAGFSDAQVFDVVAAAAWRCFFAKVPDALGVQPDWALGELETPLLHRLVVGRDIEFHEQAGNAVQTAGGNV
jgi:uncharacterized peroxidase-related enzyme